MKLRELKINFAEIYSIATLEPNLSDDSEVVVVDEPPETVPPETVSVTEQTADEKDKRIAQLEETLADHAESGMIGTMPGARLCRVV